MTTATQFQSLLSARRAFILVTAMMALAACSDSSTGPRRPSIDRVAAARIAPAVSDAYIRITLGIENAVVADRLRHDLAELESALLNGDGDRARFHVRVLETVTSEYTEQQGSTRTDDAEISAIELVIIAANRVLEGVP
jgi:hypothetical protein